jgi:hypothetical protein
MNQADGHSISRQGLDEAFTADEAQKSELLLSARLLRAQGQHEDTAAKLAQAAKLEERLSERCLAVGLRDKAWVHRFSAASCWAQAGNFYQAIAWCDDLLAQPDLTERLRRHVQEYGQQLRVRRAQWYAELILAPVSTEG